MNHPKVNPRSLSIKAKLAIAWDMKNQTLATLREALCCGQEIASDYRTMVNMGVTEPVTLTKDDWEPISARIASEERIQTIAASYGRTTAALRYFLKTNGPEVEAVQEPQPLSPQSVPFSRFGELFGPEVTA